MWWVVDVHYGTTASVVGGVGVPELSVASGVEAVHPVEGVPAAYEPGNFYRRELPMLVDFLSTREVTGVLVDGFVWLGPDRKGLGAHLHDALGCPVIGVAKRGFHEADRVAVPVLRGGSERPLWVTQIGVVDAAGIVGAMHGPWRNPTLCKRADQLCRGLG